MDAAARAADAAARAVPGVAALFAASPLPARALRAVVPGGAEAPLTRVRDGDAGVEVTVSVGISADASPAFVARAVAEAVRVAVAGELAGEASNPSSIDVRVRVGRIG
jgi:hypothetical protein